ncbi:uncharacterized protein TM35_000171760 [Trypanosoma theileri]|uniref:tRNA/rRNA methyltransferase SpoU type domain-containing protein n=1 Tax=Trypanosoma theileri TaxID=67003 RepID=A0A1X0NUB8_9TRYP|nr:uncharacterized protein TM35_000171760 [Trypanosoma theileri]ORC88304.1 hypothetical protein TM35_000171760 [Trypanosoma theileri]
MYVGMEGCTSAFNAMNSIRTCGHFGIAAPPSFLALTRMEDIHGLHSHNRIQDPAGDVNTSVVTIPPATREWAQFGEKFFLQDSSLQQFPLVALENFTSRAESIHLSRVPAAARLVIGHENNGVSKKFLDGIKGDANSDFLAEKVIYVPQYGTISSLNVVTSMGIALFYTVLDLHYPNSRSLAETAKEKNQCMLSSNQWDALCAYQRCFKEKLPMKKDDSTFSRIDQRPIHPLYYKKDIKSIMELHYNLRQLLLRICSFERVSSKALRFGLSVLYENMMDQRSLGGIVRSANAFLVDHVYYFGRKKVNVVGTIGTQHYTPPIFLGTSCEGNCDEREVWAEELQKRLEEVSEAPTIWWFLDCGHSFLYTDGVVECEDRVKEEEEEGEEEERKRHSRNSNKQDSLMIKKKKKMQEERGLTESLAWLHTHRRQANFTLSLCDREDHISAAMDTTTALTKPSVVLLIPQEGILPPFSLLRRCSKIISVLPINEVNDNSAGLPVSVAAGIALQRLSAVMHPEVASL